MTHYEMIRKHFPAYKEIRKLQRENKQLKRQVRWLAEQAFELSQKYGRVTYGGERIYAPPYNTVEGWLQAAQRGYIRDDELDTLLRVLREIQEE